MNQIQITQGSAQMLSQARNEAKNVLAQSDVFKAMSLDDQKNIYKQLVDESLQRQMEKSGIATAMATDSGKDMGYKGYDAAMGSETRAFNELVQSVDFPKFVSDLMRGVFDANLDVMNKQTKSYIALMKEATKSTSDFIKKVKDDDAFGKVLEKNSDKYNITKEKVTNPDGTTSEKMALTNANNEKVDMENAEVRKHILEAKIEMAREHRAALREILLMGVTRLVVDKGLIEAEVEFSVTANRKSVSHHDDSNQNITTAEMEYGGGLSSLFGGPSGSITSTNTNIQVNTSDKTASSVMAAKLKGKVSIQFKTDYFKLDNFAKMYEDGGVAALKPAQQGQLPGGAPQR